MEHIKYLLWLVKIKYKTIMKPINVKTIINKKAVLLGLVKLSLVAFCGYGIVSGYNNFTAFTVR